MAINAYDKGDVVRCSGAFTNSAGTAIDPTAVLFTFIDPAGTSTTYTYGVDAALAKDSTGNYHVDVNADAEGIYHWRMYSTGTGKAAAEGEFVVTSSVF
jgi:hypothetical protein